MGVDYIDLYYQHRYVTLLSSAMIDIDATVNRVDPKVPIEITVGAMSELVK